MNAHDGAVHHRVFVIRQSDPDEINRREHVRLALLRKLSHARQRQLERQLASLDAAIAVHFSADGALAAKAGRMQQVADVGRVSAVTLLAPLPELGSAREAQTSTPADFAPFNRDSGAFCGQRHIYGGRPDMRHVLFMAAVAATQHNGILKTFSSVFAKTESLPNSPSPPSCANSSSCSTDSSKIQSLALFP